MFNFRKFCLIIFLAIFLTLTLASFSSAQELETNYPTVSGAQTPTSINTSLPGYIRYIFNFSIWIAGFIAFCAVFYGGVKHLISAGDPTLMADARDQIFAGILGLIIVLSSYIILFNINPQLVLLRVDIEGKSPGAAGDIPGVYLCKTATPDTKNCIIYTMSSDTIDPSFDDHFTFVFFKNVLVENVDTTKYGVVLHEDKGRSGGCKVVLSDGSIGDYKASSITVFRRTDTPSGPGVTFYECKNYEVKGTTCKKWGPFQNTNGLINTDFPVEQVLGRWGRSIKIDGEGKYLAALFKGGSGTGKCEVFTRSDSDLASNYIGVCGGTSNLGCFESITVLPIR